MADDFDIEALLEEPFRQRESDGTDRSNGDSKSERSRDRRDRSSERERRHSEKDRDRRGSGDRDRRREGRSCEKDDHRRRDSDRDRGGSSRSRSERPRERDRSRSRRRDSRERDEDRDRHRSSHRSRERSSGSGGRGYGRQRSMSPIRPSLPDLTPEERDNRTIFCMQLAARIRPRDLEDFFSAVGVVRDVRLILDNKSHRSKGIAYIEFQDVDSVPLGIGLSGQKLLGVPIIVQPSHAERNRMASAQAAAMKATQSGPTRLYVGSLHYNINEDMLRGIFEPFGKIDDLKLMKDHQTNRSAGYGFITYRNQEDAKKAMDQMNGFELAGRPMKVGNVTDRTGEDSHTGTVFDADEVDRMGFGLGPTGRLQLMAKLAEGTGMQLPPAATNALSTSMATLPNSLNLAAVPPIATQCFMLSNMFDPTSETSSGWEDEVKDDVIDECNKHGGVLHIYVDRASPTGNVYVKCPTIVAAVASVNSLHGRYFAGKIITAAYVPLPNYHGLFPDSAHSVQYVMPSSARGQVQYYNPV